MIKFNPSTVIPKAADIEAAAQKAMSRIDAQLSKLPPVQPKELSILSFLRSKSRQALLILFRVSMTTLL